MSKYFKFIFLVYFFLLPESLLAVRNQFDHYQSAHNDPQVFLGDKDSASTYNAFPHQFYRRYNIPHRTCDISLNIKIFNFINSVPWDSKSPFIPYNEFDLDGFDGLEFSEQMNYKGQYYNDRKKKEKPLNCPKSFVALHRSNYPAIVRIFIKQEHGEKVFKGSGFFIKPNVLFTDLHVIDEPFEGLMEDNIFVQIPTVSQTAFDSHSDIMPDIKRERIPNNPFLLDSLAKSQHTCFSSSSKNKDTYPKIQNKLVSVKEVIAFSPKYDTALLKIEESSEHFYPLEKKYKGSPKKTTLVGFPLGDFSILNAMLIDEDNPMPYYKMVKIPYNDNQLAEDWHNNSMDGFFFDGNVSSKYIQPYNFLNKYNIDKEKIAISIPNYQPEEVLNGSSGAPLLFDDGKSVAGALLGKENKRGVYRFVPTEKILELLSESKSPISCNNYQCIKEKVADFLNRDHIEDVFEQYRLAQLYEIKNAIHPEAFRWYLQSAEQNYPLAQMALCRLYYYNCDLPQQGTYEKPETHWCQKAAQNGYREAQQILAIYGYMNRKEIFNLVKTKES